MTVSSSESSGSKNDTVCLIFEATRSDEDLDHDLISLYRMSLSFPRLLVPHPSQGQKRAPESTPRCLIQKRSNFAIFIRTILANFYPNLAPCLRQTQYLSEFRIRPSNFVFFSIFWPFPHCGPSLCLLASSRQQFTTAEGR